MNLYSFKSLCVLSFQINFLLKSMAYQTTTELKEIPDSNEDDDDLVNKILNELNMTNDDDHLPDLHVDFPSEIVQKPPASTASTASTTQITPSTPDVSTEEKKGLSKFEQLLNLINMGYVYTVLKKTLFMIVLFYLFIVFQKKIVILFEQISIKYLIVNDTLSKTGLAFQSFLFGLVYLCFETLVKC